VAKPIVRILPAACLAACLTTGVAWAAESPFIGAWKLNPSKTRLPDEMKVRRAGDKYAFDFGGAVETVSADGTFQPGYGTTLLSVKAEAPDTWIVQREDGGRLQLKATWKLSKDGRTLTDYFRQMDAEGPGLSMDYVYRRVGAGSGIVGDWQSIKETMNSPYSMQVTAFKGDGLTFTTPSQHVTRNLEFDGKDHPKAGPGGAQGATTAARWVGARNLVITDKAAGKVSVVQEVGLSADRKTLTMTVRIPGRAKPNVMVFDRT
jgi:hypothetical protein